MNKITNLYRRIKSWVRSDGLLHIETSALIFLFIAAVCTDSTYPLAAAAIGAAATFVIGIAKEVYDSCTDGLAEWHDVLCDLVGIAIGIIIWSLPWW